jgi:tetratricopeptide (TPR) repeat protein
VFLARVVDENLALTARAKCVEHYGAGEAYHPLLEALMRLCGQPQGVELIASLRRYAPSWLAQLPGLHTPDQLTTLERRAAGVTPGRMLREISDALEAISARVPLALCIDDLHWSDTSTLDWIQSFAHRQDHARILLIATLRTGEGNDAAVCAHALANGARVRGLATEIALARLDRAAVTEYVERRFPPVEEMSASMRELARLVHQRSEGNPLFIVNILNDLIARSALSMRSEHWVVRDALDTMTSGIPADVRGSIDEQIDRLAPSDRQLLEVASLLPAACSAGAVAAGACVAIQEGEASLARLARRGTFLREVGAVEWPDGTVSAAFEFRHALYREVLGERLSPGSRARYHQLIGGRLEESFGGRAREIAAELAVHFDHARDYPRAITYLQYAAETDQRRNAYDGAQRHLRHALALLEKLPQSVGRNECEIALCMGLGGVLMQLSGWAVPEVEKAYLRARELSDQHGLHEQIFAATWNLWVCSIARGRVTKASELATTLFTLASESADSARLLQAHHAHWTTCFALGDFQGVELHTAKGIGLHEHGDSDVRAFGSHDAGVCARLFRARVAALCGQDLAAIESASEAIAIARALDHPFTLAHALMHCSAVHLDIGNAALAQERAEHAIAIAREYGFGLMLAWAMCFRGSSLAECGHVDEGLSLMYEAVAQARSLESETFQPHLFSLIAKACLKARRLAEAQQSIQEGFESVERNGERTYVAELQRLRAELRLARCKDHESVLLAKSELRESLETAQRQGAQLLVHRAAASLESLAMNSVSH